MMGLSANLPLAVAPGLALGTVAVALGRGREGTGIAWGLCAVFVAFFAVTARLL